MGLPFSPFLLFGTLCLLGTSLRLIGTRLSGKMLLHTCVANGEIPNLTGESWKCFRNEIKKLFM